MKLLTEIDTPCLVICHFLNEEMVEKAGGRLIHYQVSLTLEDSQLSPSGDYIRFGGAGDEITGWKPCNNIVIDEVLCDMTFEERLDEKLNYDEEVVIPEPDLNGCYMDSIQRAV